MYPKNIIKQVHSIYPNGTLAWKKNYSIKCILSIEIGILVDYSLFDITHESYRSAVFPTPFKFRTESDGADAAMDNNKT